ncbi:sulfur carrier protein ThiS [uncultured Aquincola sp.]|uniref:sulfur carrier protein ThiS n=1 Tax=uncultured Aquincola sp. TaxID=886556 RepID=UPI0032B1C480
MTDTIHVQVGHQQHALPAGCSLAALVQQLGHAPDSVATAINGAFVARAQRDHHALADGDQVQCFKPITGG